MIQGQVEAYKMDLGGYPENLEKLVTEDYLPKGFPDDGPQCPDGTELLFENGEVSSAGSGG